MSTPSFSTVLMTVFVVAIKERLDGLQNFYCVRNGDHAELLYLHCIDNSIWWLCLVPASTTRRASDTVYKIAKTSIGLYKQILFMNIDITFFNIECRTRYSLTNFQDHFWLHAFYFLDHNMCNVFHIPNPSCQLGELIAYINSLVESVKTTSM